MLEENREEVTDTKANQESHLMLHRTLSVLIVKLSLCSEADMDGWKLVFQNHKFFKSQTGI